MDKTLIRTHDWRRQPAVRTILYAASLVMILAATPAAATACPQSIKSCGCVAKKARRYVLANDLTSSSATADCLTIAAAHVVLDMSGHQISGPGGAATGAGIHFLKSANGGFVDGVNEDTAKLTKFGTGILIDASDVVISFVGLVSNAQFGLEINGGSRNALYDSEVGITKITPAGNGTAGVLINGGSENIIDDIFAVHNGKYGIEISGGSNNSLHDLDADTNGIYGIWINGSNGNRVVNSTGRFNSQIGLYIGCAPTGGLSAGCTSATGSKNVVKFGDWSSNGGTGIAVDSGDLASQIGLNSIKSNGSVDAADANTNCGTNLWFLDEIGLTPSQACVE
jgi:parallel beta helix pectate lyase-like protein